METAAVATKDKETIRAKQEQAHPEGCEECCEVHEPATHKNASDESGRLAVPLHSFHAQDLLAKGLSRGRDLVGLKSIQT